MTVTVLSSDTEAMHIMAEFWGLPTREQIARKAEFEVRTEALYAARRAAAQTAAVWQTVLTAVLSGADDGHAVAYHSRIDGCLMGV